MVNKKYKCVLDNLKEIFQQQGIDPELLCARFGAKYLNKGEIWKIRNSGMPATQIIEFCDMLKAKPDDIFLELKELAVVQKWDEVFNFLQSQLGEVNFNIVPREDPILFYREPNPYLFEISRPSPGFTGRQNQLEEIHKIINENCGKPCSQRDFNSLLISGLGGIGKSQLVLFYIQKHKLDFDSIIWFHAESEASLKASISRLCSVLDIQVEQQVFDVVAKTVARKVSQFGNKNFLIFDNADNFNPWEILPNEFKTHFSIITSRHRNWDRREYKIVKLECLTEEEGVDFVLTSLQDLENVEKDAVVDLVLALECFPLALTQAISYIKMKMLIHNKYNCKDYVSEFQSNTKNAKKLLNYFPNALENDYNLVTYTTWQITFNELMKIHYENNHNEESVKPKNFETEYKPIPNIIMNIIAYLASDNIPTNLFLDVANGDEDYLSWAITLLEKYSLIVVSQGMIKTHKLVQQVTRLKLLDEKKSHKFVTTAADLLLKKFPLYDDQSENISLQLTVLPHLLQLKQNVDCLEKHNHVNKEITVNFYRILLVTQPAYIDISKSRLGIKINGKLLKIHKKQYDPQYPEVTHMFHKLHISNQPKLNRALRMIKFLNLPIVYGNLGEPQMQKRMLEKSLKIKELYYGAYHFEVARTLENLANVYGALGDTEMQKRMLEKALKIQELRYGANHFEVARAYANLANAYGALGEPQIQKMMLKKVLKIQELHYGANHFEVARTLANLANVYNALGQPQMQKRMLENALKIQELHYGTNHFEVARTLSNLANVYVTLGDTQMQKRMLEKALEIQELHYGADHFIVAITLANLANVYGALGQPQMKKMMLEKVLKMLEGHYDADHLVVALMLENLSNAYGVLGQLQMAKTMLEKALKIKELHYGADHIEVTRTLENLANAYGALGEPLMQKTMLEKVFKLQELHYGADYFEVARTLANLANAYGALGEPQTRKTMLEKALKILEVHYGGDHFEVAITLINLANAYGILDQPQMQKVMLEKALKIQEHHYGADHIEVARTFVDLANAYKALGEQQMQNTMLEKALKILKVHYGADRFVVATTLVNLANAFGALGELQMQEMIMDKVLKIENLTMVPYPYEVARTLANLANACGNLG